MRTRIHLGADFFSFFSGFFSRISEFFSVDFSLLTPIENRVFLLIGDSARWGPPPRLFLRRSVISYLTMPGSPP